MSARIKTEPVTFIATIEAPASSAETIAAGLEAAESPAALAVTLFECGQDRIEVSAHYASEPSRNLLTRLIEAAAFDGRLAPSGSSRCLRRTGWRKPRACGGRCAPGASWCM